MTLRLCTDAELRIAIGLSFRKASALDAVSTFHESNKQLLSINRRTTPDHVNRVLTVDPSTFGRHEDGRYFLENPVPFNGLYIWQFMALREWQRVGGRPMCQDDLVPAPVEIFT
jgi:hypothetical protein